VRFGATHTATLEDLKVATAEITGGRGFDYAFEVVGKSAAIRTAWRLARLGGDVIVVGAGDAGDTVSFSAFELLFEGKTLHSSLYGASDMRRDVGMLVELWRAGKLDVEGLISRRITFGELNGALTALASGEVIRQIATFE
jgi:Zn-dependent alcohol dehydrogenase